MLAVLSGHFSIPTLTCMCYLSDLIGIVEEPAGMRPLEDFKNTSMEI